MNLSDLTRNAYMLRGSLAKRGYMRWWHSFSGVQRQTGETRSFFIEFLIVNPGLGGELPILGQHPYYKKRGKKPSYVLIKAGAFPDAEGNGGKQLHSFYPVSSLKTTRRPLVMQVEDCFYSEDRISGFVDVSEEESRHRSLMTDAGVMEWELEVYKAVACNTGILASPLFQALNALDSYWHGEGIRSFFRGSVTLDGIPYEVSPDDSYGYADKHWGRNFNRPWLQFSCGGLVSQRSGRQLRHSVLAVNGCFPRFLFIPLRRKLLIQLTYTGEDYDFGFRPFVLSRCKWETKETNKRYIWHITAQNKTSVIKISGSCTKAQMLALQYENPDGIKSRLPLLAGAAAIGTIRLYRRVPGGKELFDTLQMQQGFCEYRADSLRNH
ncbi:MAG: hypothetical protein NC541_10765 [bacterium]|nr:hypothetical protein [bacterium]